MVELKGQLTIQYLASFIFFLGLVIYIYFSYSANLPAFIEEVEKEDLRSKAYQLSEILLNDPGQPDDWDYQAVVNRVGFADEKSNRNNLISKHKVEELPTFCSPDFGEIQQKLALDKPFSIHVFNISQITGERYLIVECVAPDFPKTTINATVKRITAMNNTVTGELELAELIVQM